MNLTYEEDIELRYLALKGFDYLVRNEIGSVEVFVNKPHREKGYGHGYSTWCERIYPMTSDELARRRKVELGKYDFITWANEPVLISDLIGGNIKYFEIIEPYYALIKARSKGDAIQFYTEVVADDEENMLESEIKELTKDNALGIYIKSINDNKTVDEAVKEFEKEVKGLLLIDSALT